MLDDRVERAAGVVGGAAQGYPWQPLGAHVGPEPLDQDALADPGLAADRDDLTAPLVLGALPGSPKQPGLFVAPDQYRHHCGAVGLVLIRRMGHVVLETDDSPGLDAARNTF